MVADDSGRAGRVIGRRAVLGAALLFALFLGLPILVLVVRAVGGGSLARALGTPAVLDAIALSLVTTSVSLAITVAFGLPLAYVLARRTFPGKRLVEIVIDLPIVLPPAVAGLSLLLVFGNRGLLGSQLNALGLSIPFTTVAVILAQTFVSAPFFVRSARSGIAGVDRDLEDAARADGASESHVMSWARALGEFGATIMFAGSIQGRTQTLPLVVYAEFGAGDLDASIAAATVLVLAAFGVLAAVRVFHWGRALDARGLA